MLDFTFYNPARIVYGEDSLSQLKHYVHALGSSILLHYGKNSIKTSGLYDVVIDILTHEGIKVVELGGVTANPTYDLVAEGIALCKEHNLSGILAVGGGSVIDSAKGIAAGVLTDQDDFEMTYVLGTPITRALPVGCILTIPAAGSESSPSSVVTVKDGLYKRSIKGECLIPQFAIINPRWFTTLRIDQAAPGISDIFSHLLERYFTNTRRVDYTDRLLEATMRTLIHYGPHVVNHLDDVDAWAEIGFAGTLAHNGLLGSGREEDWSSHRIEHELTALYDITHGLGLAIVFPAWMKYVSKLNPDRFVQFAQRVFDIDYAYNQKEATIAAGIAAYERFLHEMYLPTRLHEAGILTDDTEEIIKRMFYKRPDTFGNFVALDREAVCEILKYAK